jgi:hypothetical protein
MWPLRDHATPFYRLVAGLAADADYLPRKGKLDPEAALKNACGSAANTGRTLAFRALRALRVWREAVTVVTVP